MSIAPQNLMAKLRGMEDADLAKYAQMHQQNPYIFPLAFQESQTRKQVRTAKEAQMAGQQQPKVVQQDLAQMAQMSVPQMPLQQQMPAQMAPQQLPEDSGIGQLPAQNMQGMADGGIVGYAEGGVPRYQGNTTDGSVVKSARELLREQLYSLPSGRPGMSYAGNVPTPTSMIRPEEAPPQFLAPGVPNPAYAAYLKREATRDRGVDPQAYDPNLFPVTTSAAPALTKPVTTPVVTPAVTPAVTPDGKPKPPAPTASSGQDIKTQPPAGLPSVASFADQLMGIDKYIPKKEEAPVKDTFMKEREDVSRPVYEKATAMLEKEKSRLNEGKEQDFYMALIEGGLEAAAGNSPNGLQNLAAGFSKGAKSYSVALKDFRKAAQENSKMELDMERARAAEKRGDMDAFQKYDDSIKNRNADIDKLKTSGIFALQNVNTSGAYQLQATGMTTSSQEKIAKLSRDTQVGIASMAGPQERLFATLGGGKDQASVLKGLQRFQEAQTDKTGLGFAKLYVDHVAESNKAGMTPMTEGVFLDTMTRLASQFNPKTVTDPGKSTVLDRPR